MEIEWQKLDEKQKKESLFLMQKETLDCLLSHKAITQAQYDKSLGDLKIKMGIKD